MCNKCNRKCRRECDCEKKPEKKELVCMVGNTHGAGSTLQTAFDRQVLANYNNVYRPGMDNNFTSPWDYNAVGFGTGSGAGVNQVLSGAVAFGGSDPFPNATQDATTIALNPQNALLNFPIVMAAVSIGLGADIAAQIPAGGVLKLTAQNVADIFSGAITMWNDASLLAFNSFLSAYAQPIQVIARSDASGDTANFTNFLAKAGTTWPANAVGNGPFPSTFAPGAILANGNGGVQTNLLAQTNGIAYLAFGFTMATGGDPATPLPLANQIVSAAIQNPANNFIVPTVANIQTTANDITTFSPNLRLDTLNQAGVNGMNYPICEPTNLIVIQIQPNECQAKQLRQVLKFFATFGPTIANGYFFGAIPAKVITQYMRNLDQIIWM